jgi:hypothetical protein
MRTTIRVLSSLILFTGMANADPVLQTFGVWPANHTYEEKASLYHGWTNGYLAGLRQYGNEKQLKSAMKFGECLEKLSYRQAVDMIDKYYKEHPETWAQPLPDMLLKALTVSGPCQGKEPK